MDWVVESQRLGLRPMTEDDFDSLCVFLQDAEVMAAWEHAVEKATGGIVGAMGPLIETIGDERHMGVAYILAKAHWGRGLTAEGAGACMAYAFSSLGARRVIAEIRPENRRSRRVAERLGMQVTGEFVKRYHGKDMLHLIYSRERTV